MPPVKPVTLLNAKSLVKLSRSKSKYAIIDTTNSISSPEIALTNSPPQSFPENFYVLPIHGNKDLADRAIEVIDGIIGQWGKYCYTYQSFDEFLKETRGISIRQYRNLLKFSGK